MTVSGKQIIVEEGIAIAAVNRMETRREPIRKSVLKHLGLMEELFQDMLRGEEEELQKEARDALTTGGKRIRPTLAFLASSFGDVKADKIVPLMAMIELMHSGSLIHDDVVDHAMTRRGRPTVNAEKGSHVAVQVGDYALSRSMRLLERYKGTEIGEALAETAMEMCIGELQQLRGEYEFSVQSIADYLTRIKRKTAYLMANSCYTGSVVGELPNPWKAALKEYGLSFGMAFQLCDDILDYEGAEKEGKPVYQDMNRGIFTLPLLYAMEKELDRPTSTLLCKRGKSDDECRSIVEWVRNAGGIAHTKALAAEYVKKAIRALESLPGCEAKELLTDMVNQYGCKTVQKGM